MRSVSGGRGSAAQAEAAAVRPSDVALEVCERIERTAEPIWITRVDRDRLLAAARELDHADPNLPLYGRPFAVKDNIDIAGMPTTAGCPGYARIALRTAPAVQRLLDAGALLVGKTNLDQFATGLTGTRSAYGACSSVFDARRVSGGSSSGSALAVARGLVSFALGTDTAGSGRVPAAFNGIVGLKPSRGLISTRGVVPACASLDCVSILASSVGDAEAVLTVAAGFDPLDPWSRRAPARAPRRPARLGVPLAGQVEPSEPEAAAAWALARGRAGEEWMLTGVDVTPLLAAAPLLYRVWVAERAADLAPIVEAGPEGLDPTVAAIISSGSAVAGTEVFGAIHELAALRADAAGIWDEVDALLLPTAPFHPTHADVAADPIGIGERLGAFTNFVNLLDLAALALPGPPRRDGLPFGVTLLAPAFSEDLLIGLGREWAAEPPADAPQAGTIMLAVAGAHMRGLPLNHQLTARGGRFLCADRTSPAYRLLALPGAGVKRPGLVRVAGHAGASIEVELWELPAEELGSLIELVPAPLAIGRVELAGGGDVAGFVCEAHAAAVAQDISDHGGWRAYLDASARASGG